MDTNQITKSLNTEKMLKSDENMTILIFVWATLPHILLCFTFKIKCQKR